jgi:coatomer subunit beta'
MAITINAKDPNMFATASLDKTVKIWTVGTQKSTANYSLVGHEAGVNCVDFSKDLERPHICSGSDDGEVKVWDYQTRQCLFTFDMQQGGHNESVSSVMYHPEIPIILSGGEDDVINVWSSSSYKAVHQLNYGLKRIWGIHAVPEMNAVAFGFDEGTVVIKIGKELPLATFANGKVVWVKSNEIQTFNLKLLTGADESSKDGEIMKPQNVKELG